jgi:acyl carrier protein
MDKPIIQLDNDASEGEATRQIEGWLLAWTRATLKLDADRVDLDTVLMELGLDSVEAVFMLSELEAALGVQLDSGLLLECPTGRALAPRVAHAWATRGVGEEAGHDLA